MFRASASLIVAIALCGCVSNQTEASTSDLEVCRAVSIYDLWNQPWEYDGMRVCVEGYLGQMVPHGEDSLDLYRTDAEALDRFSQQFVSIGLPMTLALQERLASTGLRHAMVVGTFTFDERCWPDRESGRPTIYRCAPERPMRLVDPVLIQMR